MHADPLLPVVAATTLVLLGVGLALRRLRQPHVLAYLLAGVALGPHGLGIFSDTDSISRLGDFGIILLLFFVGMEMSLPRLVANWRIAVLGTLLQILLSLGLVAALALALDWPLARAVLIGFVISLSSTAVAVSMLSVWGHLDTKLGLDVLGILIVQDLAVAPMLLTLGFLSRAGGGVEGHIARPILGVLLILVFSVWLLRRERISLPFGDRLRGDHELQVFAAAFICTSSALVTVFFELSTALGALIAGVIVASADEIEWVSRSLEPFRVMLVALFFVSMGLLLDLHFVAANVGLLSVLIGGLFLTNTFVNAGIVRLFGRRWPHALFAGAILAQAGAFSFVLAAIGFEGGLISDYGYQLTVAVIAGSLLLSPLWVAPFRAFARRDEA
jgi:CPA2 family monovalent cation:H+ antiporter-2